MEKLLEYSVRCRHANNFHEPRFLPTNNERGRDVANRITENIILLFRYFYDTLLDPDPDFPAHKFRICPVRRQLAQLNHRPAIDYFP